MLDLENKDFQLSGGIFKAEATSDGGLAISGYATLEVPDKSGEIIDFPTTMEELQKWSNDTAQRSGGKSKGNLRVMHQLALGGKVTDLKAVKATIPGEDGKSQEVNAVLVDGYIPPSLPDVIKNVQEGVLNGFSIGGKYKARPQYDAAAGASRYTPLPTEISLVDNPCCPGADIVEAIQKAAGTLQKGSSMAEIPTRESLEKADAIKSGSSSKSKKAFDGSFDAIESAISSACAQKYVDPSGCWHGYVCRTFPDKAIISRYDPATDISHYYEIPYTIDGNGVVTLGDASEVQRLEQWIPVEMQKAIEDKLRKAAADEKSQNDKLHEAAESRAKKYGISFKPKGSLTPPKDNPTDESEYGDPVNYGYPTDSSHIKVAVSYFNQDGQQKDGGYSDAEWETIGKRIAEAANKLEGAEKTYSYKSGKIDIETKEAKKSMNPDEIRKAAEAAGLSGDALDAFVTKMTKADGGESEAEKAKKAAEEKAAAEKAAKEEAERKAAEEAAKDPVKKAATTAGMSEEMLKTFTDELQKAGKSISSINEKHLNSIVAASKAETAHIEKAANAIMTGQALPDDQLFPAGQVSPLDASDVDDAAKVSKAVEDELNKAGIGDLNKAAIILPDLQKAVGGISEAVKALTDELGTLKKTVQEIHDAPTVGGPVSLSATPQASSPEGFAKMSGADLQKALNDANLDPQQREALTRTLSLPRLSELLNGGK